MSREVAGRGKVRHHEYNLPCEGIENEGGREIGGAELAAMDAMSVVNEKLSV